MKGLKEKQIEALVHKLAFLQKQLFGRKTEQTDNSDLKNTDQTTTDSPEEEEKLKRGKQKGTKVMGEKSERIWLLKRFIMIFPKKINSALIVENLLLLFPVAKILKK